MLFVPGDHANAEIPVAPDGDYYIRSETPDGVFNGVHQLMPGPKPGYVRVVYCDHIFWIRGATVIWSERESAAGQLITIENNNGGRREIFCLPDPAALQPENLGLDQNEIDRIRADQSSSGDMRDRLRSIRDGFTRQ
ncbi:hypothetical protein [Roseibium sp. RKSG952]|uniref:hypothetical protein n=1 Tax=Roseibium sp. RKSG952 TaxID=2529384 RepID=UPI0012BD57BC|nr:hypothetical protein [Roseibium sp. RKSG952]MTH96884.1 hypothetical protein [Roseibium sp. RKSG952]